ncbi:hypothetical protein HS088_TW23G00277 [Tripterygium wilfordii]|uniref:HMA domain-containing protein n=2 Tax=Tripterygium wilfordii TaxID=458696 RepID=A0A7J7BUH3_TRIWF|nr:hypothetical protein HS088_TW23G00277 [Tripterygium wilfordii]
MSMHCEGCVNDIKRNIEAVQGILSVEPDREKSLVTVKGVFDPPKLAKTMSKRFGKHVEILKQEQPEKGKDNNKGAMDGGSSTNITMFHYPPQYSNGCIYPPMTFSDENVFSCSLM